jgi:DNA-binding response OmpR family regulator
MTLFEPTRALIVDDDPVVARSIARRLIREGYTVSLAQTCRGARALGGGFHVAVLDLDLPDGNGTMLADDLLRYGAVRQVLFYTGSLDPAQRERAEQLGTVIDKACELDDVLAALEPSTTAPPISLLAPAPRPRPSGFAARRDDADDAPTGTLRSKSSTGR